MSREQEGTDDAQWVHDHMLSELLGPEVADEERKQPEPLGQASLANQTEEVSDTEDGSSLAELYDATPDKLRHAIARLIPDFDPPPSSTVDLKQLVEDVTADSVVHVHSERAQKDFWDAVWLLATYSHAPYAGRLLTHAQRALRMAVMLSDQREIYRALKIDFGYVLKQVVSDHEFHDVPVELQQLSVFAERPSLYNCHVRLAHFALTKSYQVGREEFPADTILFDRNRASLEVVVGPNAAGKTSLLRTLWQGISAIWLAKRDRRLHARLRFDCNPAFQSYMKSVVNHELVCRRRGPASTHAWKVVLEEAERLSQIDDWQLHVTVFGEDVSLFLKSRSKNAEIACSQHGVLSALKIPQWIQPYSEVTMLQQDVLLVVRESIMFVNQFRFGLNCLDSNEVHRILSAAAQSNGVLANRERFDKVAGALSLIAPKFRLVGATSAGRALLDLARRRALVSSVWKQIWRAACALAGNDESLAPALYELRTSSDSRPSKSVNKLAMLLARDSRARAWGLTSATQSSENFGVVAADDPSRPIPFDALPSSITTLLLTLTALHFASTVLIDEPETHLRPELASGWMRHVVDFVDSERHEWPPSVMIVTHSPEIFRVSKLRSVFYMRDFKISHLDQLFSSADEAYRTMKLQSIERDSKSETAETKRALRSASKLAKAAASEAALQDWRNAVLEVLKLLFHTVDRSGIPFREPLASDQSKRLGDLLKDIPILHVAAAKGGHPPKTVAQSLLKVCEDYATQRMVLPNTETKNAKCAFFQLVNSFASDLSSYPSLVKMAKAFLSKQDLNAGAANKATTAQHHVPAASAHATAQEATVSPDVCQVLFASSVIFVEGFNDWRVFSAMQSFVRMQDQASLSLIEKALAGLNLLGDLSASECCAGFSDATIIEMGGKDMQGPWLCAVLKVPFWCVLDGDALRDPTGALKKDADALKLFGKLFDTTTPSDPDGANAWLLERGCLVLPKPELEIVLATPGAVEQIKQIWRADDTDIAREFMETKSGGLHDYWNRMSREESEQVVAAAFRESHELQQIAAYLGTSPLQAPPPERFSEISRGRFRLSRRPDLSNLAEANKIRRQAKRLAAALANNAITLPSCQPVLQALEEAMLLLPDTDEGQNSTVAASSKPSAAHQEGRLINRSPARLERAGIGTVMNDGSDR